MGGKHSFLHPREFDKASAYGNYDYDPEQPLSAVLLRIRSTVLPRLLRNFNCWWVVMMYIITYNVKNSAGVSLPELNIGSLTICVTFVSFMVTFFAQNAWEKYWSSYALTQHLGGNINDFTVYSSVYLSGKDDTSVWEMTRLMQLMHHRFYCFIADEDEHSRDFHVSLCTKIDLPNPPLGNQKELATQEEVERLQRVPTGVQHLVLMKDIIRVMNTAFDDLDEYAHKPFQRQRLEEILHQIRMDMGLIATKISKPIPLQYFHLVVLIVLICTTVYAYAAALLPSEMSWIPLMAYTFGVSGVLEVSRVMAIPFGHDDVDLPAMKFWERAFNRSFQVLQERTASYSRSPRLDVHGQSTEHSALLESVVLNNPPTMSPPQSS